MTRLLFATALVLLGGSAARTNTTFPYPPNAAEPPKPPPADRAPVVVGVATAAGVMLAGLWLLRRRTKPQG